MPAGSRADWGPEGCWGLEDLRLVRGLEQSLALGPSQVVAGMLCARGLL